MKRFQIDPNEREPIYETDPAEGEQANIIYIRPRMNVEIAGKVSSEAVKAKAGADGEIDAGAYLTALLVYNVVGWSGPDFDGLPCTPETIRNLPGSDPFIVRVRDEIAKRNQPRSGPSPKLATVGTSTNDGSTGSSTRPGVSLPENPSLQLATTTEKSPLRSALDGRLNK